MGGDAGMSTFYWDQDLTTTDSFAGAGGLGLGTVQAGATLRLAVNHDERSLATYKRNFPTTEVRRSWLEEINWKEMPDTLLKVGGPECTNHSRGKGEKRSDPRQLRLPGLELTDHDAKPEAEKSRASMWQIYRAAQAKFEKGRPYHSLILENVPEVTEWSGYQSWEQAMLTMSKDGKTDIPHQYEHQVLYVNAMHFGVPQCRDRWIAVFWSKGAKKPDLDFRPTAFCRYCDKEVAAKQCWKKQAKQRGRYDYRLRGQYTYRCPRDHRVQPYYRPAASVVDFSDRGVKIGERAEHHLDALDEKTVQRIHSGIEQFVKHPQIPPPEALDVPAIEGLAPFWITFYSNGKPYSIYEPFCTFSTHERCGLVFPPEDGSLDINQCSFRMINESEIKGGSGLPHTYEIVATAKEEVVRQCGHMVPPPMAQWVANRVISAIKGEERAA
jgi:site-specific DNA-cytosine methylase